MARLRLIFLLVLLTAVAVRVSLAVRFAGSPFAGVQGGDMLFYHEWAQRIAQGEWTDHHAFYGLPGYAFLAGALYRLFGEGGGLTALLRLQDVVAIATAVLIFDLARRVISGRYTLAAAFLASLGWDLFVPAQALSLILMPTVWLVLAYWLCVRFALGKSRAWFAAGLLVGVTATFVATVLFALPLLLAAAWQRAPRRWLAALLLAGGVALGTAPVWLHNAFIAHEPVFLSAHVGINFYIGNYTGANGYPKIPPSLPSGQRELLEASIRQAEVAAGHPLTRPEVSRYWSQKAWAEIRAQPGRWLGLLGRKATAFWNHFVYDDLTIIALFAEDGVLLPGPAFGVVAALGLGGLLLALWQGGPPRWIAAAVLLHGLALMSVFITERYRLAAVPGLFILGAFLLAWAAEELRKRWPAALALALLGAACVFLPAPGAALTTMEPYNLAISELEHPVDHPELLERARAHLEMAQRYAPNDPHLLFAFGGYWGRKGDSRQEEAYYRRAIAADPAFADAYINLGLGAIGQSRWPEAIELFRTVTHLQPENPSGFFLLAVTYERSGDYPHAREAIEEALRLSPGDAHFEKHRSAILAHEAKAALERVGQ